MLHSFNTEPSFRDQQLAYDNMLPDDDEPQVKIRTPLKHPTIGAKLADLPKVVSSTGVEHRADGQYRVTRIYDHNNTLVEKTEVKLTHAEISQMEYDAWKSKQRYEDEKWRLEQQLGFNPYRDYDYD